MSVEAEIGTLVFATIGMLNVCWRVAGVLMAATDELVRLLGRGA